MKVEEMKHMRDTLNSVDVDTLAGEIVHTELIIQGLLTQLSKDWGITIKDTDITPIRELATKAPVGYFVDLEFDL